MYQLVLASNSPRRRDILLQAGFELRVFPLKLSESIDKNLNPKALVQSLAEKKCREALLGHSFGKNEEILMVCADTLVFLNSQALGKPHSPGEAAEILCLLSGKTHSVITGVAGVFWPKGERFSFTDETLVEFRALSQEEIRVYVDSGEPMDKAGAYGIQGGGAKFVKKIEGSWHNVVGFPLEKFLTFLKEKNCDVRRRPPEENKTRN